MGPLYHSRMGCSDFNAAARCMVVHPFRRLPIYGIIGLLSDEVLSSMRGSAHRRVGRFHMIEVSIDSVKVSLVSQYRLVVLKESGAERYLPIWIGPFEAEAITLQMQGVEVPRPLTHDLLKKMIATLGGHVSHIVVTDLRQETFYANIVLDVNGKRMEID